MGQALFAAGAGLSSLHAIIGEFDRECAELFKAGGSKPELNQAIKRHHELIREIRSLSLAGSEWEQQRKKFESAAEELVGLEAVRLEQAIELERLKRLQRALAPLARRRAILVQLSALDGMARLCDAESRRERLNLQMRGLDPRSDLLEQEETIDSLHQRLGVYRQAKGDRPGLVELMLRSRTEAEGLLRQAVPGMELSGIDELKLLLAQRQRIQKLAGRYTSLRDALGAAEKQSGTLDAEAAKRQRELSDLPPPVDTTGLATAVGAARKAGDLDDTLRRLRSELLALKTSVSAALSRLGLWQGTIGELLTLPLPGHETVNRFADTFAEQERQAREASDTLSALRFELDQARSELKAMETTGAIPTEGELRLSRGKREQGWQLIRRAWLAKENVTEESRVYGNKRDLPEVYEETVRMSDEISDRLRGEAERVHKYATCRALGDKLEEQLVRMQGTIADLVARRQVLESEWRSAWQACSITPLTPREMRDWLDRALEVRRQTEEISRRESETGPLAERIAAHRLHLQEELAGVGRKREVIGEGMGLLLSCAETILEELAEISRRREKLTEEFKRLTADAAAARAQVTEGHARIEAWRREWTTALQAPDMLEEPSPEDMMELLERLTGAFARRDASAGFQERINSIDLHAGEFERDAASLVSSVAPERRDCRRSRRWSSCRG